MSIQKFFTYKMFNSIIIIIRKHHGRKHIQQQNRGNPS